MLINDLAKMDARRKNLTDPDNVIPALEVFAQIISLTSQGIELLLKRMFNRTSLIKSEELPARDYQRLIDLIENRKSKINSTFLSQLEKKFSDFRSISKTHIQEGAVCDAQVSGLADTAEQIVSKELESIISQFEPIHGERYQLMLARLGYCANHTDPDSGENPLHIKSLLQCFQYATDDLGLDINGKIALYRLFTSTVIDKLEPLYKTIEQCFIEHNIMPKLKLTTEKPSMLESIDQPSKPDELIAMSQIPVLMGLFQEFKEKSNFSDGEYCNLYPELKQALGQRNITNFDSLINLLSAKFDLIFSDDDLPDPIKEQIARLQIYLFLSAMQERELLKRSGSPARRLLDTVIRTEVDLKLDNQEEKTGYSFLRDQIDQLGNTPFIAPGTYADVLESYQTYIEGKTRVDVELVEAAVVETKVELTPVEHVKDNVVEFEEASVKENLIEDNATDEIIAETEAEIPVLETTEQADAKKDKAVPLADVKPVSMAEAMVRSLSRPPEMTKPELIKPGPDVIVESKATDVNEKIVKADQTELPAEQEPEATKGIVTAIAPEPPKRESRDNIYPVIQSIVNDMTLPLRVQGRSLIFFDEVWSPLLLEVARTRGFKSPAWQNILTVAKTQAWAFTTKNTEHELKKLISSVGHIEKSLSQSMQSLKLPHEQVVSLLEFLEHEQAEVIAISKANIEQLEKTEKLEKQKSVEKRAQQNKSQEEKSDKTGLPDTIDEFSSMMETGRFKQSNDMLKALNTGHNNENKTQSATAETIHKSDWVEIKKGSSTVLAKLTWRAEDRSQFIFVDRNGNRVCEIDKDNLNRELEAGTISLISSTPINAQRPAFSVIQTIK